MKHISNRIRGLVASTLFHLNFRTIKIISHSNLQLKMQGENVGTIWKSNRSHCYYPHNYLYIRAHSQSSCTNKCYTTLIITWYNNDKECNKLSVHLYWKTLKLCLLLLYTQNILFSTVHHTLKVKQSLLHSLFSWAILLSHFVLN